MNVKLSIILILSLLNILPIASQQVKFGVEAGANLSHYLASQKHTAEQTGGMKAGFQVGATVDYEFKKHWTLSSGLTLLQNRSTMKFSPYMVTHFPKTDTKINNLILPLKIGYNFHITERFCLMPSIGLYAAYGFSVGNSSLEIVQPDGEGARTETHQWNPMKGYSYPIEGSPNNAHALLTPFRHWEYGGTAGLKAIIAEHYTVSFNYMVGIKQVHDLLGLRNSNFQLNIGYRF